MKKVLITGATGFIGRHCLPILTQKGYEIHAVSPQFIGESEGPVRWHTIDLLNASLVFSLLEDIKPTHLLHFAWYTEPGKCWTALENIIWTQASLDLLQSFLVHGGQRVVMAGTCAEYDWTYSYCSENITPLAPHSLYGVCKHALQTILYEFCKQTKLSGAWGRIFFLYGPNEHPKRLVPSVINSLLAHKQAECTHGNQIRDYLYVQDVADAFVELLDSDLQGAVNIASGSPVALRDIIFKIADKLDGNDLIRLGALTPSADEPSMLFADVRRLTQELKWSPKIDLHTGLDLTINWARNNYTTSTQSWKT